MSKQIIWLIIAGAAALIAVPMIYLGLENDMDGLLAVGFVLFTLGMLITPVMRLRGANK